MILDLGAQWGLNRLRNTSKIENNMVLKSEDLIANLKMFEEY